MKLVLDSVITVILFLIPFVRLWYYPNDDQGSVFVLFTTIFVWIPLYWVFARCFRLPVLRGRKAIIRIAEIALVGGVWFVVMRTAGLLIWAPGQRTNWRFALFYVNALLIGSAAAWLLATVRAALVGSGDATRCCRH